jgi:hypothetical protein
LLCRLFSFTRKGYLVFVVRPLWYSWCVPYCSPPYCSHLTYPFVLPWSLLEAITTGCTVVASNTAPVEEFLSEGPRSRLVDFFDVEQLKMAAIEMLGRDKENLHVRPIEGREKKPIGSVESALLAYRKLFGIQKYTQGKNSVYQPLNSKINCNAPRHHAKNATRKCVDQSEKIAHRIWILGNKRRSRLLKNRKTHSQPAVSQKRTIFLPSNGINTPGTLLNVPTDAEAKLKNGIAA